MSRVLVLTSAFFPHRVASFEQAVTLLYNEPPKAEVVQATDEVIHPSGIRMPSVIRLLDPVVGQKRSVKFSRMNVYARDKWRCSYCLAPKRAKELNYDHVVPRHLGGRTCWENVVASCYRCNTRKANRTPEQAGMLLRQKPHRPTSLPVTPPRFDRRDLPPEWANWIAEQFLDDGAAVA